MEELLQQLTLGNRPASPGHSTVSEQAIQSIGDGDEHLWVQMGRELDSIGVRATQFEKHKSFIFNSIKEAVERVKHPVQNEESMTRLPAALVSDSSSTSRNCIMEAPELRASSRTSSAANDECTRAYLAESCFQSI